MAEFVEVSIPLISLSFLGCGNHNRKYACHLRRIGYKDKNRRGVIDSDVNGLLGIDGKRELSLCLVPIGKSTAQPPAPPDKIPVLNLKTLLLSKEEVDYPAIRRMHSASSLECKEEVINWRGKTPHFEIPKPEGSLFYLKEIAPEEMPHNTAQGVILHRGSTRMFSHRSMTFSQLSTILSRA